jgi:cell division protein FtsN
MTRDFAKKPRNGGGPKADRNPERKPARKTARQQEAPPAPRRSQVPAWVWLFTGAVLGAFIMFLVYLSGIAPSSTSEIKNPVADQTQPQTAVPKPRFDFYQLLKESEVVVQQTPNTEPKTQPDQQQQEYILQVGSFKRSKDADRLRAELILMNLQARVETVTVRNGETWHRVLVGPFQSQSRLAKARSTLVSNDINPLLQKRKKS